MCWSISLHPIREPDYLDQFMLSLGKAVYFANGYEIKCRSVLQYLRLVSQVEVGHDLKSAVEICNAMKNKMLHDMLVEISMSTIVTQDDTIQQLVDAKDARNLIAHEVAYVGPLYSVTTQKLNDKYCVLQNAVSALAIGDNLVSQWLYEIEECEAAPRMIIEEYSSWVLNWVFGNTESKSYAEL